MTISPPPADPTPTTPGISAGWYADGNSGRMRWWDGTKWTENYGAHIGGGIRPSNGAATAALVLGIIGFVVTPIPFFIGLLLGFVPDVLAIIFGIVGIAKAGRLGGLGRGAAVAGLVLGSLAFISIFFGAGTIW